MNVPIRGNGSGVHTHGDCKYGELIWIWSRSHFQAQPRAVVARAPPEILDPSDFGANAKSMGQLCVFICFSSYTLSLKIFSKILPDSSEELITL